MEVKLIEYAFLAQQGVPVYVARVMNFDETGYYTMRQCLKTGILYPAKEQSYWYESLKIRNVKQAKKLCKLYEQDLCV